MLELDVTIHARPLTATLGEPIEINGQSIRPLQIDSDIAREPFSISFEQAAERLTELDAMIHLEPDGWFIWHSPTGEQPVWQINGNLFDRGGRLWHVPLRGTCPEDVFRRILSVLADDAETGLMFELTQAGVFVELADLVGNSRS
jgi:hypothetical protein